MSTRHPTPEVNDLVGKAWRLGGRGPDAFDCWGLVREVLQRMRPGLPLPDWASGVMTRQLQRAVMSGAFPMHCEPTADLDTGVLLYSERAAHIGILVSGMVLTASRPAGVIALRPSDYVQQFGDLRAYAWRS